MNYKTFTTVTTFSKIVAMALFVSLPFMGFYYGVRYANRLNSIPINTMAVQTTFRVNKTPADKNKPNNYKYELIKSQNGQDSAPVYTFTNEFGFNYYVSPTQKYIAIIRYSDAMGDETLIIINVDGKVVKDFGRVGANQSLNQLGWTDNVLWLSDGVPIGKPNAIISVDADTLEVGRYK